MTHTRLADMVGGWFVGNFEPTTLKTSQCEVAVKSYKSGATEAAHVHRIATEVTLIASGRARMCGREFVAGDIITLAPGDVTGFVALEDTTTVVVKMPSVMGDKYLVDDTAAEAAGARA